MIGRLCLLALAVASLAPASAAEKLRAVATFSIVGDIVGRIADDKVDLTTLVGPDGDAHVFEPTPADARVVARARIVFLNGLGFEPWIDRLMKSSGSKAKRVALSQGVQPRFAARTANPHAWQDVRNVMLYVENVTRALSDVDAGNATRYKANAAAYLDQLRKLDAAIRASMDRIAVDRRRVITSHDAFGYFSAAYGVTFVAPLGMSLDEQASAKRVAALISQIRREKITAVFVENISDPRLIEQIARETGTKLGGRLYSDALSTREGPAPTYVAMMRHNAKLLTGAMSRGL